MDDAGDDFRVIRFVCTDRGRHPEMNLGTYSHTPVASTMSGHKRLDSTIKGRNRLAANSEIVHSTMQLECPRCGRTPQLSERTLSKLAEQWHGDEIDVSLLPF